jgi:hypothetical protein
MWSDDIGVASLSAFSRNWTASIRPIARIRLILDNHSAHISKETQTFLTMRPNRFKYVHTPTHGSWLNIAETLFGKMARTFLEHIRVQSWEELRDRILRGVAEINAAPVVHRWKKFDLLTSQYQYALPKRYTRATFPRSVA